jgi:hypothetical protein
MYLFLDHARGLQGYILLNQFIGKTSIRGFNINRAGIYGNYGVLAEYLQSNWSAPIVCWHMHDVCVCNVCTFSCV